MVNFGTLSNWVSSFWLTLHLFVLRAVIFVTQKIEARTLPARIAKGTRSVLVIGDELAEGLGDGLGRTGLVRTIDSQLREARLNDKLRLPWRVMTSGRTHTNTQSWLPEGSLFERVFPHSSAASYNPHIVIILFGARDNLEEGTRAPPVNHVVRIAEALVRRGIHVIVPDFVNFYSRDTPQFTKVDMANNALRRALGQLKNQLRENEEENKNNEYGTIMFNADVAKVTAMGGYVVTQFRELEVFNSLGYKLLAAELRDDIIEVARRVEWVHWKERLSN